MNSKTFYFYLADLAHDYLPARQFVPLGIGYLAAYAKFVHGNNVEFRLFKSTKALLDAIDQQRPDLFGATNYIWNVSLTAFAARKIKKAHPDLPIIMGGPNIRTDEQGISDFLGHHEFVDLYCVYNGEEAVADIVDYLLSRPRLERTSDSLRQARIDGCYSLHDGRLTGNKNYRLGKDLDYIPSPYISGILDEFLDAGFMPIMETNRGCPFSCSFCYWGVAALNKLKKFSLDRVYAELDYICKAGWTYPKIVFADANFGILKRDVDIARRLRDSYDETGAFSNIEMYWSKSAPEHMVDIGRILGHLTNTYIAFQSFDDDVLGAVDRANINIDRLVNLIDRLRDHTHSTRTDILVGLPKETVESHLHSLDQALSFGIDSVGGGEIRMLPGTPLESDEHRTRYGIKTKYRFSEGDAGIYRGELIYELEEVVRATDTMSEENMIWLRALRALFFGGVTLSENRPLVTVLNHAGVRVTDLFRKVLEKGRCDPAFARALDWLFEQARMEWFDTPWDAAAFAALPKNRENLFNDQAFAKLNFALLARLILAPEEYDGYYKVTELVLNDILPDTDSIVIPDILRLCRERNFLRRCIEGNNLPTGEVPLALPTLKILMDSGFLAPDNDAFENGVLKISMDPVTAGKFSDFFELHLDTVSNFSLSQLMQSFAGRFHMEPEREFTRHTDESRLSSCLRRKNQH
ncbi:MAG: hypothetical protein CMO12_04835 [Thaumarchaeota archaeon]|nr:hypothetical protein [Nitrososphaerota archaeon]